MSLSIVTDAIAIDSKSWGDFVCCHPEGTVFQTPQMYSAYMATKNYEPIAVACYKENCLVGILLAVVQKEYRSILGKLSARSVIWGGPLLERRDGEILNKILDSYESKIKRNVIYSQFRNLFDVSWVKPFFNNHGYYYEEHLNILIDLNKSEEELWKLVHSKRRNEIRRAIKEKTDFSIHNDENALNNGYEILKEVYKIARLPLPDISLFQNILSRSTRDFGMKIFAANHNDKMIGVMFALLYKKRIYDWYAGSFRNSFDKYPNDLIPWEVMKWGKANGYEIFDFGGAGKPNVHYGVRDYKIKFGGDLVNFGHFEKIHHPILMKIAKLGFRVWQSIKK